MRWRRQVRPAPTTQLFQSGLTTYLYAPGKLHEGVILFARKLELFGQQFRELQGGFALVGLDFTDRGRAATRALCQFGLGQVERFTPPL